MDGIDSASREARTAGTGGASDPAAREEPVPAAASRPFPIVGVGASAGGLEAFTQLIRFLPPDTGMAFVLVQHLGRATTMPVVEVTDGLAVRPNRIYVIPPNMEMVLRAGALRLAARSKARGAPAPIDAFLRSLAAGRRGAAHLPGARGRHGTAHRRRGAGRVVAGAPGDPGPREAPERLLPICAGCRKIRDDRGYWNRLESCLKALYPDIPTGDPESGR